MNKLRKVVSAGPSGGRYGIIKWIIALVFILLAGGGIGGVFNQENDSSLSTVSQSNSNIEDALQAFDGNNFEHLPKMVKLPVIYDRVVDGDTQIVTLNGHDIRVRHLMIDTPESVKEGTSVQPFGKESSQRNDELLSQAETLYMMLDVGPATDQYNRVLAYIYADNILVAEQLLKEGLASVRYVKAPNNSFEDEFKAAQQQAIEAELNIWSIENYVESNGYFNQVD
ncbi:thermonuclease family protein [Fundicoccus sp. Sow4_D5]